MRENTISFQVKLLLLHVWHVKRDITNHCKVKNSAQLASQARTILKLAKQATRLAFCVPQGDSAPRKDRQARVSVKRAQLVPTQAWALVRVYKQVRDIALRVTGKRAVAQHPPNSLHAPEEARKACPTKTSATLAVLVNTAQGLPLQARRAICVPQEP